MDILSIFTILEKFNNGFKWGKTKKEDSKNKEIIRSRLKSIFTDHKSEIEILFIELLDETKGEIPKNDNEENYFFLDKIEELKKGDLIENIDNIIEKEESIQFFFFMWKIFFYDDKIKNIQNDLNINIDKFLDVYFREAKNYFESGKEADIKLLLNEKKEVINMLEKSVYEFEKIILVKIQKLVELSIINSINPNSSINNEKITNMIKNVDKFAKDIDEGKMKKYYSRFFTILNSMIDEMIEKIRK
ncbi:MAG: hypothetical protein PHE25_04285 [Candidatus Gracilibacteria bacterium]|nr:hypothetical protein [Candidatus Gracilibacteria bacterium]